MKKQLDARNVTKSLAKKKDKKSKKEEWLSNIIIRPVKPKV